MVSKERESLGHWHLQLWDESRRNYHAASSPVDNAQVWVAGCIYCNWSHRTVVDRSMAGLLPDARKTHHSYGRGTDIYPKRSRRLSCADQVDTTDWTQSDLGIRRR